MVCGVEEVGLEIFPGLDVSGVSLCVFVWMGEGK